MSSDSKQQETIESFSFYLVPSAWKVGQDKITPTSVYHAILRFPVQSSKQAVNSALTVHSVTCERYGGMERLKSNPLKR